MKTRSRWYLHEGEFQHSNAGNKLHESGGGDRFLPNEGSNTVGEESVCLGSKFS